MSGTEGWQRQNGFLNLDCAIEEGYVDPVDGKTCTRIEYSIRNPDKDTPGGRWFELGRPFSVGIDNAEGVTFDIRAEYGSGEWVNAALVEEDGTVFTSNLQWDGIPRRKGFGNGSLTEKWITYRLPFADIRTEKDPNRRINPGKVVRFEFTGGAFPMSMLIRDLRVYLPAAKTKCVAPFLMMIVDTNYVGNAGAVFEKGLPVKLPMFAEKPVPAGVDRLVWKIRDFKGEVVKNGALVPPQSGCSPTDPYCVIEPGPLPSGYFEITAYAVRRDVVDEESCVLTPGTLPKSGSPFAVMPCTLAENLADSREYGPEGSFFGVMGNSGKLAHNELLGAPWSLYAIATDWSEYRSSRPTRAADGMTETMREFFAKPSLPDTRYGVCSFKHWGPIYLGGQISPDRILDDPEMRAAWTDWVRDRVRMNMHRFPHMAKRPYELAWEPHFLFPPYGRQDPEKFVRYWALTYEIVKATDPNAVIWGPKFNYVTSFEFLLKAGLGKYIDEVSVHIYPGPVPEEDGFESNIARIRADCRKYIGRELPIVNTEGGFYRQPDFLTHAAMYVRFAQMQLAEGLKHYLLFYTIDAGISPNAVDYGMYCNPLATEVFNYGPARLQPKTVVPAYAVCSKYLRGAKLVRRLKDFNAGFTGYAWKDRFGKPVLSLWNPRQNTKVSLPVGDVDEVRIADIMGVERPVAVKDGQIEINVTSVPVYLFGADPKVWLSEQARVEEADDFRAEECPGLRARIENGQPVFVRIPHAVKFVSSVAEPEGKDFRIIAAFTNVTGRTVGTDVALLTGYGREIKRLELAPHETGKLVFKGRGGGNPVKPLKGEFSWRLGEVDFREKISVGFLKAFRCDPSSADNTVSGEETFTNRVKLNGKSSDETDMTADIAFFREPDGLRVKIDVDDAVHVEDDFDGMLWRGDAVQIAFDTAPDFPYLYDKLVLLTEKKVTMMDIGLCGGEVKAYRHNTYDEDFLAKGYLAKDALKGSRIVHENGKTHYDLFLPWKEIGLTSEEAVPGKKLGVSLLLNDSDFKEKGCGRKRQTLDLFGGIKNGTDYHEFGTIVLE